MVLNPIAESLPSDAITSSVNQILGYGLLGILALALVWLFVVKGWRVISPAAEKELRASARTEGRADLERENGRLIAEKQELAEQRDDAIKIAQTQVVPLLTSFNATMTALLPLLQRLVADQEAHGGAPRRRG